MATVIKLKKSETASSVPTTSDLAVGEVAVNTADQKIYVRASTGVVEIANASSSGSIGLSEFIYTATASQTTFSGNDDNGNSLSYTAGSILVYQNGILLEDTDDYTASNGTSVVLQTGALVTDTIQIISITTGSGGGGGSSVDLSAVAQDIIPDADGTRDLGSASKQWGELHLSGGTFFLGGAKMQTDPTTGAIAFIPRATASVPNPKGIVLSQDGKLKPVDTTGGSISTSTFQAAANSSNSTPSTAAYTNVSDLPLSGVSAGTTAFVSATNRLYLWTGTGWYNIALVNNSPSITSGAPGSVTLNTDGTATVLTLVATDPEELPITWSFAVTSGSLTNGGGTTATVSQSSNVFTITPTTNQNFAGQFTITFTASDGVNTATSASQFSLSFAFTDTNFASVVALYDGTGVTGDNDSFVDTGPNSYTSNITKTGDTVQVSFSPYYFPNGYKSVYFDGADDDIRYTSSGVIPEPMAWLDGSTDSGTYELFVKLDGNQPTPSQVYTAASFGCVGGTYINFGITNAHKLRYYYYAGGANYSDSTTTLSPNTWNHIALVRDGTTIYFYINGSRDATSITSYSGITWGAASGGESFFIGRGYGVADTDALFKGHISNLRSSDIARYSGTTYTVPTSPFTSDGNTLLLTCQSNQKKDNSSNSYTLTFNSVPQVKNYYPDDFTAMQTEYIPATQGGSVYFDNSGDYLQITSAAPIQITNSDDFTIEFWCYLLSSGPNFITGNYTNGGSYNGFAITVGRSGQPAGRLEMWTGTSWINIHNTIHTHEWNHIAVSNDSGTLKFWVNGVAANTTATATCPATISNTTVSLGIGENGAPVGQPTFGYVSDYRFVKGTAVYTSAFTPPTSKLSAISNTSLLMNFANYALQDRTGKEYHPTFSGNATLTDANYLHLRYASFYDGSGDYHTVATNTYRAIGTNTDFTLEAWVKVNAFTNYGHFVTTYANVANDTDYFFRLNASTQKWQFQAGSQNVTTTVSSTDLTQHTWHHLAVTRSSGNIYLWQDGVQVGGATADTQNFNDNAVTIGRAVNGYDFNGYITDVRLVVGTAVYTSGFTPPTSALTAISGTQMLITSSASTVADAGAYPVTITNSGNVSTTKEVDHNTNFSFPNDVDGTLKFRGDTDFIKIENNEVMNLRDQDFTIDFWFKRDAVNGGTYGDTFICNVSGTGAIALAINPSGYTGVSYRNTATGSGWTKVGTDPGNTYGSIQVGLNKWTHYAVTRSGTTGKQFINGAVAETFTFTGTLTDWNNGMHFSHWHDSYTRGLIGEIFGFRITKGVARYTSAFNVPTEPPGRRN